MFCNRGESGVLRDPRRMRHHPVRRLLAGRVTLPERAGRIIPLAHMPAHGLFGAR